MLLANQQGFPEDLVLEWADQLLSALDYIHANNVIHRDIKPANIRRTTDGRIFLVDFGLVKPYNLNDPRTMTMFHGIGTPEYAPPEQYDSSMHTDQRSDIYALGATLYHLLTGQAPISVTRRTTDPAAFCPPRQARADISPEVERVILRAMEIERAKRFATAADMRAALNLIRRPYLVDATRTTDLSALAAAAPPRPDRRRRALVMISVPILLFLGVLIGIALQANTGSVKSASTTTPAYTPTNASTSTTTGTPTGTPTISTTATVTMVTTSVISTTPGATVLPGGIAAPKNPVVSTPVPTKAKITPPGQAKTKEPPPGQSKTKESPPGQTNKSATTPDANPGGGQGDGNSGGGPDGNSDGSKPEKTP
jgi:serine/threonine protein kinase